MLEEDFLKAIVKGDSQRVVRLLGQITNTGPLKDGRNALHLASQYGNSDIVSVLLLSGLYDCNTPDSIGYTAIQIASADGHLEIVKLLIKHGADVNSADNVHGNSALHEAAWKGFSQTVSELCKAKSNLNAKNWGGFTALHLCCQNGHNQSCRELLLAGCDADVQNNYGDTPLHTSARYGHAGVMRILISAQCHVSDQNKNGDTALHIAAAMNRRKLTRILLESKCDKSVVNKQNETAEAIAVRKSQNEILDILTKPPPAPKKPKNNAASKENAPTTSTKKTKHHETAAKSTSKPHASHKKLAAAVAAAPQVASAAAAVAAAAAAGATGNVAIPWSPYGCHYYPESTDFPEPNLDSLPPEPLQKGEQYYLDLAGNIRKGPVGVGYSCYCAPFFHELESRIEKKAKKIKKQLHRTEDAINKRLNTLEYCLNGQYNATSTGSPKVPAGSEGTCPNIATIPNSGHEPLSQTRSFDSVFDSNAPQANPLSTGQDSRQSIPYFHPNPDPGGGDKSLGKNNSDTSSPCCQQNLLGSGRRKYFSSGCLDTAANINLWQNTRLPDADSCESSDEDGEKVDIPCNDSGYSTKMCSNSQGPSPSLSGRLENDGLLSVTPSQEEKHIDQIHSYVTTFQNMTIKQASMV